MWIGNVFNRIWNSVHKKWNARSPIDCETEFNFWINFGADHKGEATPWKCFRWRLRIRASQSSLKVGPAWICLFRWKLNDTPAYWAARSLKRASNDQELIISHFDPFRTRKLRLNIANIWKHCDDSVNSSAKLANPKLMREGSDETAASPSTSAHSAF